MLSHWIERTLAGDQQAFALIFDQYKNLVYKTAYLILNDAHEADDALQETFLKAYHALGRYQSDKGAFSTWLYRITVNQCRNQQRQKEGIFRFLNTNKASDETEQSSPSPEFELGEEQALHQALARLSPKLRVVIILRYFLDLSYAEIAQILGLPLGTVKSRLNMALKTVGEALQAESLENLHTPRGLK
jgi:RNA polymerase sigma-70 factor (ECF subfamily)